MAELGPHRCYWEPFCGSMAVLLAKPAVSMETVNDLNGDLVNLARVVCDGRWGPWLYRQLRRTLFHEDTFDRCASVLKEWGDFGLGQDVDAFAAERAYAWFVGAWMGRSGVIGTKETGNAFSVRYDAQGGFQGQRWAAAVNSIPQWRRRLREVVILRRDGIELLGKIEDLDGVAIYCDPPYIVKGAQYLHDFKDIYDHVRLAEAARRFKWARVVISYYQDPALAELYPGWTLVEIPVAKTLAKRVDKKARRAVEVLLINGPSYTAHPDLFADVEG